METHKIIPVPIFPKGIWNKFRGKPFPEKFNRGAKLQPYDPKSGRFLSYDENHGLLLSPMTRLGAGIGLGLSAAKGVDGGTPVGRAGNLGYMVGYLLGNILP